MTRRALAGLVLVAALARGGAAAEGAIRPAYGGVARLAFSEPFGTLDPTRVESVPEHLASRSIFEPLAGPGGLARSVAPLDGGLRWRIGLDPRLIFHDGSPCDAEAVRRSLARALDAVTPAAAGSLGDSALAFVTAIEAVSDTVVEIALSVPGNLPLRLADPRLAIAAQSGAGTGPFLVEASRPAAPAGSVMLRLAAFDAYRGGRPYLDAIEFVRAAGSAEEWRFFTEGRADLVSEPAPPAAAETVIAAPESALVVARLPAPLPVFAGALVRAIRPEAMIRFLPRGYAAAPALKPSFEMSDEVKVPEGVSCVVSAPAGNTALERVAERVQVDRLDAGLEARLAGPTAPGALAVIETCQHEPPAGSVAILSHARRYAVAASLVNVRGRGCGPDLDSAWRRR